MKEHLGELNLIIAGLALIGPALLWIGWILSRLSASTKSAHHRIDKHEAEMDKRFDRLQQALVEAVKEGWRHCPLAMISSHAKDGGD